jgi:hypothetical protein
MTPAEILKLLGVCCDGGTAERLAAARTVLDAYEEQDREIERLKSLLGAEDREFSKAMQAQARAIRDEETS